MISAIYEGTVQHARSTPAIHAFTYPLFMLYLDLAELETAFAGTPLWRHERPALDVGGARVNCDSVLSPTSGPRNSFAALRCRRMQSSATKVGGC